MCGIAGRYLHDSSRLLSGEEKLLLEKMADSLKHRGPDDSGILITNSIGFAFARLAILDLISGHQPMQYANGRYSIVFNGEIYNHQQLRRELESAGFTFKTRSDTEVLLALYARHGRGMLAKLNGMFAFGLHDRESDELFAARDRLGIKPLYYSVTPSGVFFASEIKALRLCPEVDGGLNPQAFDEYLSYGYIPAPDTIFRAIRSLPPGHWMSYDGKRLCVEQYWEITRCQKKHLSLEDASEELLELLRDSVSHRMISDVPLGAFLSGGIDSGLIVSVMSMLTEQPVKTFSVGFPETGFDERDGARAVANKYHTDHTEIFCSDDMRDLVSVIATSFDQPFADSSALPTYLVCREARKHSTVVLSGDGGDECFAGYNRHMQFAAANLKKGPPAILKRGAEYLDSRLDPLLKGAQRLRRWTLGVGDRQLDTLTILEGRIRNRLAGERLRNSDVGEHFENRWREERRKRDGDALELMQRLEFALYLPGDILEKVDKMSMLHSLEVRVPFLDHRIVEFGISLPSSFKNDGIMGKLILRQLGKSLLPPGHLERPKVGFAIPRDQWMRVGMQGLVMESLNSSQVAKDGWLNQEMIARIVDHHMKGQSLGTAVWTLLVLELWYRSLPHA